MMSRLTIFRSLAVLGLAVSSASLADQMMGDPTYCSFDSGCEEVTSSAYGKPLGIPLPFVGLVGFAGTLSLTLLGRDRATTNARRLVLLAAIGGLVLILVQVAVLGRICPLCLVADGCAIAMGLLAIVPFPSSACATFVRVAWSAAAAFVIAVPILLASLDAQPDPPDWVRAQWVDGKINVVEVTDFECDHCRKADEYMRDALKDRGEVHLVRIPIAMQKHPHSRPAAIAFLAAQAQGRGEEMGQALFTATSLAPADCRRLAETLGLRMTEYDRVVADPAADAEVTTRSEAARIVGSGAPLVWIQSHYFQGSPTEEKFDGPLRRARPYRAQ